MRYPESFRGTGQNGQVLKEDFRNWSRKLHNQKPLDLYPRVKLPYKSIIIVSIFLLSFYPHFRTVFYNDGNRGNCDLRISQVSNNNKRY